LSAPVNVDHRYVAQLRVLDSAIGTLSAFSGLLMENTTRGYGWRFLEVGRRMERTMQMSELLHAALVDAPVEIEPYLQVLLQIADSSITYRRNYLSVLRTDWVLELLLADESNPRSVGFQLATLLQQMDQLSEQSDSEKNKLGLHLAATALQSIRNARME